VHRDAQVPRPRCRLSAANELALDFISLTWESYDIALPADALGAAQPLITALGEPKIRAAIAQLGGYDLTPIGQIQALDHDPPQSGAPANA
jgi:molybdate-binding protein